MNMRHLLRMAKWAHKPPSASRVKLVFGVVLIALLLFGVERLFGWPDWLTVDSPSARKLGR